MLETHNNQYEIHNVPHTNISNIFFHDITAKKLGYTKKMWDNDKEPDCCDEYWDDLDEDQREAATVLGYDKESWDNEGAFAKCCVIL
jgi:hypothetical protein